MTLTRQSIMRRLAKKLEPNASVFAMWLEGADALGTVDAYSDIDLWLDVEDGQEDVVLEYVRQALMELAPLDMDFQVDHPHPQIRQAFFHLEGSSDFLILDLCIQSHSRAFAFVKGRDAVRVLFDKVAAVRFQETDKTAQADYLRKRAQTLAQEFEVYRRQALEKCLARGDFLESLYAYQTHCLKPLVELLRIKYVPEKHDHHLKHVGRDLPDEVARRLERLYRVDSFETLKVLYREACGQFEALVLELKTSAL